MQRNNPKQLSFTEPSGKSTDGVRGEEWLHSYLISADLSHFSCEYENWEIGDSSAKLSYLSHGFFRYFGKFPPPVARRFIEELHDPASGPVIDPMVGSGTTLVEACMLRRSAIGLDVNPLSCLISYVVLGSGRI